MGVCASSDGLLLESYSDRREASPTRELELVTLPQALVVTAMSPVVLSRRIRKMPSYTHFPDISMHDIDLDNAASAQTSMDAHKIELAETPQCDSRALSHPLPAMAAVAHGFFVGFLNLPQQTLGLLYPLMSTPSDDTQD
jgi:hypothetical protein